MPSDTRPCPCCSGAAYHRKQTAVDDFKEVKCASCDEDGQVFTCVHCGGEGDDGRCFCIDCNGTGLNDYTPCDMAKTLENTRERPAKEDF